MDLKEKKVLVTGAGGFMGSHLVEHLVQMGVQTKAFVHYNSFNSWGWIDTFDEHIQNNLEVLSGDIRGAYGVRSAVKGCDAVFHLAALIGIPFSYCSPDSYVDTNVRGTLNVVQAARDLGVGKVVHISTSEVYGTGIYFPMNEEHPLQGQSPYSASKIGADQIALSFFLSFGTPVSVARPFNTYGPRQSARAIIPTIITQVLSGKKKVRLGSLHPTRDLNYVKDTVNGLIRIAESERTVGEVVNIGSNGEISMGNLVEKIAAIMDVEIEVEVEDQRIRPKKSEVERLWADNSKALELTGWKPMYTLDDGLKETIKWFSSPKNLIYYRDKVHIYNI